MKILAVVVSIFVSSSSSFLVLLVDRFSSCCCYATAFTGVVVVPIKERTRVGVVRTSSSSSSSVSSFAAVPTLYLSSSSTSPISQQQQPSQPQSIDPVRAKTVKDPSHSSTIAKSSASRKVAVQHLLGTIKQGLLVSLLVVVSVVALYPLLAWSVVEDDVAPPPLPIANLNNGAALFQSNCAGCHAGGQNFIRESKTLQKDALEKYLKSTNPIVLQKFVQTSMPHTMTMMRIPMTTTDYYDVASFVSDQARNDKW